MAWGKYALLTIPLILSGIVVVASPAAAQEFSDTDWKVASAGGSHACGIDNSGYLYCWGNDDSGQLGNTAALNSKTEPDRIGDSRGWTAISAGGAHTCGIRSGKLYCWGSDEFGQLGNGRTSSSIKPTPQQISGASDWLMVTAGITHTCAIRNISGKGRMLACWGDDSRGQIGNGSLPSPTTPAFVSKATDWSAISAGGSHTCGLRSISGKGRMLACWGSDQFGQVGNGSLGGPNRPAQVSRAYDWKAVSAGESHTCGIRGTGMLACWGSDEFGQIGNGGGVSASGPSSPAQVAKNLPTNWKSVSAGGGHTCGIKGSTDRLYCWGDNQYGQSVAASEEPLFTAPQLYAGSWKGQDTGHRHSCAIGGDGRLSCWGVPDVPPDCPAPATNIYADEPWQYLSYWKLTTPIDANGDGRADEVKQPALKTLDGKEYFDRLSNPTRIEFRADVDGATTSGSQFPRSELREMTQDGQYNRAAWSSLCGTHQMTVTQAITEQPDRVNPVDPVVAGQIHDGGVDGGHGDVIMIRLEGTRLFVEGDNVDYGELDSTYRQGETFTVVITANNSGIDVSYNNASSNTIKTINNIQPQVNNEQWYFKAGVYTQASSKVPTSDSKYGTGYGEVVIYDLDVEHS